MTITTHSHSDHRLADGAPAGPTDPAETLRRVWGFEAFRPLQLEAIEAALGGSDAVVVMPTGGGKSLCYQLPAACGAGLVLVVSPLIALMDDQVAAARQVGLRAASPHSNLASHERAQAWRDAERGDLDLLYVSPERLAVGDVLQRVGPHLALIAVDEAHCVSQWEHDFRPEYRQLAALFEAAPHVPRMALTATATEAVARDVVDQLKLRQPRVLVGHPDRPNLQYRSFQRRDAVQQSLAVIKRHPGEGGIVYTQTRKEVERIATRLRAAGVDAGAYHAGLNPEERARVQTAFLAEQLDVVVATIAFGMGIDRSNVRYVVHANAPKSIEHYQQESGRAGRDGLPAECVLLFGASDLMFYRRLQGLDGEVAPERQRALERQLRQIGRYAVAPVCRHRLLTEHFGQPYPPPSGAPQAEGEGAGCGACDVCLEETVALPPKEALEVAQKILSAVYRTGARFGGGHVAAVLRGKVNERITRCRHDDLSVFGLLAADSEAAVRAWIDQLVLQDKLLVAEQNGYPILQLAPAGAAVLRGQAEVRLTRFFKETPKRKRSRGGSRTAASEEPLDGESAALFEKLRDLRKKLAQVGGFPAYVVAGDVTLRALAQRRPQTEAELLAIPGIGEAKLQRYGQAFLEVLSSDPPSEEPS